jgi:hypothetical protein
MTVGHRSGHSDVYKPIGGFQTLSSHLVALVPPSSHCFRVVP